VPCSNFLEAGRILWLTDSLKSLSRSIISLFIKDFTIFLSCGIRKLVAYPVQNSAVSTEKHYYTSIDM
jgi:hypothetical protein